MAGSEAAARAPACKQHSAKRDLGHAEVGMFTDEAEELVWKRVQEFCLRVRKSMVFWDKRLDLYPTGFRDRKKELRYIEFYWVTFAVNHQTGMFLICAFTSAYFAIMFLRHTLHTGLQWSTTGLDVLGFLFHSVQLYYYSMRHMPSAFKKFCSFCHRGAMIVIPIAVIADSCFSNPANVLKHMVPLSTLGGWTCPYFFHHVCNLAAVAFLPLLWSAVMGVEASMPLPALALRAGMMFLAGTAISATVNMYQRQEWSRLRKGEVAKRNGRRSSRSPSRHSSSRSPSRGHKRSSSRGRSMSPLPRVEEVDGGSRGKDGERGSFHHGAAGEEAQHWVAGSQRSAIDAQGWGGGAIAEECGSSGRSSSRAPSSASESQCDGVGAGRGGAQEGDPRCDVRGGEGEAAWGSQQPGPVRAAIEEQNGVRHRGRGVDDRCEERPSERE